MRSRESSHQQIEATGYEVFEVGLFNSIATANEPIVYRSMGMRNELGTIELAERLGPYFGNSLANPIALVLLRRTAPCTMTYEPFASVRLYSAS